MNDEDKKTWGPDDLRIAHEQIDKAFWELSNWFHGPGSAGQLSPEKRAEKLGVPLSVVEATDSKLASLGHMADTLEQLLEVAPRGVILKSKPAKKEKRVSLAEFKALLASPDWESMQSIGTEFRPYYAREGLGGYASKISVLGDVVIKSYDTYKYTKGDPDSFRHYESEDYDFVVNGLVVMDGDEELEQCFLADIAEAYSDLTTIDYAELIEAIKRGK